MISLRLIISPLALALLFLVGIGTSIPTTKAEASADAKLWALLVAGSHYYYNYRHQADICHAYHVLHNHGIPDERIVVMMYDDIARDQSNPTPGIIINHLNGSDVYAGVPKDYTGDLVTPKNFLSILQGKKIKGGSGKVIASGPNDHVFVYVDGQDAYELIAFPDDELHATDLIGVIKLMHEQEKFGKLVFYVEASESGSMFENLLPDDINVYATTAANSDESSYACYWDDFRQTYLGDVYSVKWMEDSDREDLHKETLLKQFKIVRSETKTSHVTEFGDLKIANLKVSEFQGAKSPPPIVLPEAPLDAVDSRDVPIAIVRKKLQKATDPQIKVLLKHELDQMLRNRAFLKEKMVELVSFVTLGDAEKTEQLLKAKIPLRDHTCYEQAVRYFDATCFELSANPHALAHLRLLVNMCEEKISVSEIREAMDNVCTHPTVVGIV
ncbi:legumain-like [Ixodes scapularis]|uniref:legumain-like n=1 Tax=Ixodes scapularis TaxID=6945 RepID=UPI001C381AB4|nr:legumain-like [Ixodes scapularis]